MREYRVQKNKSYCYLSQKKSHKTFVLQWFKKDLITQIYINTNLSVLMRYRYISPFNRLLLLSERGSHQMMWGQTLSRSYGRCIAEFLDEESLVHLGLLALSTCVGLRYGRCIP